MFGFVCLGMAHGSQERRRRARMEAVEYAWYVPSEEKEEDTNGEEEEGGR